MLEAAQDKLTDIAVLDDDLDFRTYLEDFLKDEGIYSVRTFARASDLFAACEERTPDIVLLDMKMGDVSGDQVLEQLLARWPGLCVIVITGYPSLEDMRATFKLKPGSYVLFCNIVEETSTGEKEVHFANGMFKTITVKK